MLAWIRGFFAPFARHPAWVGGVASVLLVAGIAGVLTFQRKTVSPVATVQEKAAAPALEASKDVPAAAAAPSTEETPAAEPKPLSVDRRGRTTTPAEEDDLRAAPTPAKKKVTKPAPARDGFAGGKVGDKAAGEVSGTVEMQDEGRGAKPESAAPQPSAPPPPESAPAKESERAAGPAPGEDAKRDLNKGPQALQGSTLPRDAEAAQNRAAQEAKPAPAEPARKAPAPAAQTEAAEGSNAMSAPRSVAVAGNAREEQKVSPSTVELHQAARKQATAGACNEALALRDRISRIDPGYFNKNVAGDVELRRCLEQRRKQAPSKSRAEPAPRQVDSSEKNADDKANKAAR